MVILLISSKVYYGIPSFDKLNYKKKTSLFFSVGFRSFIDYNFFDIMRDSLNNHINHKRFLFYLKAFHKKAGDNSVKPEIGTQNIDGSLLKKNIKNIIKNMNEKKSIAIQIQFNMFRSLICEKKEAELFNNIVIDFQKDEFKKDDFPISNTIVALGNKNFIKAFEKFADEHVLVKDIQKNNMTTFRSQDSERLRKILNDDWNTNFLMEGKKAIREFYYNIGFDYNFVIQNLYILTGLSITGNILPSTLALHGGFKIKISTRFFFILKCFLAIHLRKEKKNILQNNLGITKGNNIEQLPNFNIEYGIKTGVSYRIKGYTDIYMLFNIFMFQSLSSIMSTISTLISGYPIIGQINHIGCTPYASGIELGISFN